MSWDLVCINCPKGCRLHIDDQLNVTGNSCPRGIIYGKQEVTNPTRIVTSSVVCDSSILAVCPVKTAQPIPKGKIFDIMKEINKASLKTPTHIGEVVIRDVCGTGVDVVCTRDIPAEPKKKIV